MQISYKSGKRVLFYDRLGCRSYFYLFKGNFEIIKAICTIKSIISLYEYSLQRLNYQMKAYSAYEKIHEQLRKQNNVRYVLIQHSILTPPRVSLSVSLSLSQTLCKLSIKH